MQEETSFAAIWCPGHKLGSSISKMHPKLDNPLLSDAFCDLFPSMTSRSQPEMCCVDRHIHPSTRERLVLVSTTTMSPLVTWRFLAD